MDSANKQKAACPPLPINSKRRSALHATISSQITPSCNYFQFDFIRVGICREVEGEAINEMHHSTIIIMELQIFPGQESATNINIKRVQSFGLDEYSDGEIVFDEQQDAQTDDVAHLNLLATVIKKLAEEEQETQAQKLTFQQSICKETLNRISKQVLCSSFNKNLLDEMTVLDYVGAQGNSNFLLGMLQGSAQRQADKSFVNNSLDQIIFGALQIKPNQKPTAPAFYLIQVRLWKDRISDDQPASQNGCRSTLLRHNCSKAVRVELHRLQFPASFKERDYVKLIKINFRTRKLTLCAYQSLHQFVLQRYEFDPGFKIIEDSQQRKVMNNKRHKYYGSVYYSVAEKFDLKNRLDVDVNEPNLDNEALFQLRFLNEKQLLINNSVLSLDFAVPLDIFAKNSVIFDNKILIFPKESFLYTVNLLTGKSRRFQLFVKDSSVKFVNIKLQKNSIPSNGTSLYFYSEFKKDIYAFELVHLDRIDKEVRCEKIITSYKNISQVLSQSGFVLLQFEKSLDIWSTSKRIRLCKIMKTQLQGVQQESDLISSNYRFYHNASDESFYFISGNGKRLFVLDTGSQRKSIHMVRDKQQQQMIPQYQEADISLMYSIRRSTYKQSRILTRTASSDDKSVAKRVLQVWSMQEHRFTHQVYRRQRKFVYYVVRKHQHSRQKLAAYKFERFVSSIWYDPQSDKFYGIDENKIMLILRDKQTGKMHYDTKGQGDFRKAFYLFVYNNFAYVFVDKEPFLFLIYKYDLKSNKRVPQRQLNLLKTQGMVTKQTFSRLPILEVQLSDPLFKDIYLLESMKKVYEFKQGENLLKLTSDVNEIEYIRGGLLFIQSLRPTRIEFFSTQEKQILRLIERSTHSRQKMSSSLLDEVEFHIKWLFFNAAVYFGNEQVITHYLKRGFSKFQPDDYILVKAPITYCFQQNRVLLGELLIKQSFANGYCERFHFPNSTSVMVHALVQLFVEQKELEPDLPYQAYLEKGLMPLYDGRGKAVDFDLESNERHRLRQVNLQSKHGHDVWLDITRGSDKLLDILRCYKDYANDEIMQSDAAIFAHHMVKRHFWFIIIQNFIRGSVLILTAVAIILHNTNLYIANLALLLPLLIYELLTVRPSLDYFLYAQNILDFIFIPLCVANHSLGLQDKSNAVVQHLLLLICLFRAIFCLKVVPYLKHFVHIFVDIITGIAPLMIMIVIFYLIFLVDAILLPRPGQTTTNLTTEVIDGINGVFIGNPDTGYLDDQLGLDVALRWTMVFLRQMLISTFLLNGILIALVTNIYSEGDNRRKFIEFREYIHSSFEIETLYSRLSHLFKIKFEVRYLYGYATTLQFAKQEDYFGQLIKIGNDTRADLTRQITVLQKQVKDIRHEYQAVMTMLRQISQINDKVYILEKKIDVQKRPFCILGSGPIWVFSSQSVYIEDAAKPLGHNLTAGIDLAKIQAAKDFVLAADAEQFMFVLIEKKKKKLRPVEVTRGAFKECYGMALIGAKLYYTDAEQGALKVMPFKIIQDCINAEPDSKPKKMEEQVAAQPISSQITKKVVKQSQQSMQEVIKCWDYVAVKLRRPYGLTAIGQKLIFSLELGNEIRIYSEGNSGVLPIVAEDCQLSRPRGIFAIKNQLYIADSGNKRIIKANLDASNEVIKTRRVNIRKEFEEPSCVTASQTKLIVSDTSSISILQVWVDK